MILWRSPRQRECGWRMGLYGGDLAEKGTGPRVEAAEGLVLLGPVPFATGV